MNKLTALAALVSLAACQATMHDPDDTIATFSLYTDNLEALVSKECVAMYGSEQECTPYPNEMECDRMSIAVKADGRTVVDCVKDGRLAFNGFAGVGDGVPYMCKSNPDMSCVLCVDIYGNTIHDSCNRGAQLFRGNLGGFQNLPAGAGYLEEPSGTPPATTPDNPSSSGSETTPDNSSSSGGESTPDSSSGSTTTPSAPATPPSSGNDKCKAENAILLYAKKLNKILEHEGLSFSWSPDTAKLVPKGGFLTYNGSGATKTDCDAFTASLKSKLKQCAVKKKGECYYCWGSGSKKTCRCARVTTAAIKSACAAIPADCDRREWSAALIKSFGVSHKWLFSPSYAKFYGQVTTPAGEAPKFPTCMGSPLVLDLTGDGIEPTAPATGVRFDLLGHGELQTSWVKGDDALLALDRNNNGRIDSGAELFGEASSGLPHDNGFDALAELDSNRDGKLDRADVMFRKLLVWQDVNSDGVSQRSEMRTLRKAGIRSLDLSPSESGKVIDRHGNDLSLRASFTRADGSSGAMVDVFFVTAQQ